MSMCQIFDFFNTHWIELIAIIITYFGVIWPIIQYLNQRKQEERDKRFINFHRLIKEFVEEDPVTKKIMLDRQIAIAFEFRNYPNYYDLLIRLLKDLRKQWANEDLRLLTEIDLTLKHISFKRTFKLFRIFKNRP